jgi:hypothetical protein
LNAAVVKVPLDLVDGHTFSKHLRRPPMSEIAGFKYGSWALS